MRVIADLVMNHTSADHPWFQESRADPAGPKGDWYVWSDTDERYPEARDHLRRLASRRTGRSTQLRGQYYWHRFFHHQPDLNFDNPEVQEAMLDVLRFWLDLGIDGFRLDAVPYLFEREGTNGENLPETHEYLKRVRAEVEARYPDRVLLAEANQWPEDVVEYFGDGDECQMAFHFPVMPRMFMALRREDATPDLRDPRPDADDPRQLPVGSLPPQPRRADARDGHRRGARLHVRRVREGPADEAQPRHPPPPRTAPRRRPRRDRSSSTRSSSRCQVRPFSITGTRSAWATTSTSATGTACARRCIGRATATPVSRAPTGRSSTSQPLMDPVYGYQAVNVEAQLRTPNSLLRWMQRFIALRKEHPVFGLGDLPAASRRQLARLLAHPEVGGRHARLRPQPRALGAGRAARPLASTPGWCPVEMLGQTAFPAIGELPYLLTLAPRGFFWFQLRAGRARGVRWTSGRSHRARHAAALVRREVADGLTRRGPRLRHRPERRAAADARPRRAHVRHGRARHLPALVSGGDEGQHPTGSRRTRDRARAPERDAGRRSRCRARRASSSSARPRTSRALGQELGAARLVSSEQSNSSVVFDDALILKVFRRVEPGINPELEVLRFLSEHGFRNVAGARGAGTSTPADR